MPHIVLTEEQARILTQASLPVEVRDEQGRTVARLTPLDPEEIEAIERWKHSRNSGDVGVPSEQVQAHFRRLEEIRQRDGLDLTKALDLLRRMRAGEQV
jgi:antitoxin (DNA-binding transcriptional repressor) of toxin-antitoxin stability system